MLTSVLCLPRLVFPLAPWLVHQLLKAIQVLQQTEKRPGAKPTPQLPADHQARHAVDGGSSSFRKLKLSPIGWKSRWSLPCDGLCHLTSPATEENW